MGDVCVWPTGAGLLSDLPVSFREKKKRKMNYSCMSAILSVKLVCIHNIHLLHQRDLQDFKPMT